MPVFYLSWLTLRHLDNRQVAWYGVEHHTVTIGAPLSSLYGETY